MGQQRILKLDKNTVVVEIRKKQEGGHCAVVVLFAVLYCACIVGAVVEWGVTAAMEALGIAWYFKSAETCVISGDIENLKRKIESGIDVNAEHLLHAHASSPEFNSNADDQILQMLLAAGADINATRHGSGTPLHIAATISTESDRIAQYLTAGADVDARDSEERTPLHMAVRNPNPSGEVISVLLEAGADVDARDSEERTPLHIAADCGDTAAIEQLIRAGANTAMVLPNGDRAADIAERNYRLQGTVALRDLWLTTPRRRTDSASGTSDSRLSTEPDLPESNQGQHRTESNESDGASVRQNGSAAEQQAASGERAPTELAIPRSVRDSQLCDIASLAALLDSGVSVTSVDSNDQTLLHLVARTCDSADSIDYLLEAGASIDASDRLGRTPLHIAARSNANVATLDGLLQHGGGVSATDADGRTPLHVAAAFNTHNVVAALLAHDIEINALDSGGQTPLHRAAKLSSDPKTILILLQAGADPNVYDRSGKAALHFARQNADCYGTDALAKLEQVTRAATPPPFLQR